MSNKTVNAVKIKNEYIPIDYMGRYFNGEKYKEPAKNQKIFEFPLLEYEYGMKMRDIIDYCNEYNLEMFLVGNDLKYDNCTDKWIVGWIHACYKYNQFIGYFDNCISLINIIKDGINNKLKSIGAIYRENNMMLKVISRAQTYKMDLLGYISPSIDIFMLDKILKEYYLLYLKKYNNVDYMSYDFNNDNKDYYNNKNNELRDIADYTSLRDKITFFTNEGIADLVEINLSHNK